MLQQIITLINNCLPVEKIFLLGTTSTGTKQETIFGQPSTTIRPPDHYQLLILTSPQEKRDTELLQELLEARCRSIAQLTAIVLPIEVFNQWRQKGHLLAHYVGKADCLVYDARKIPLQAPGNYHLDELHKKVQGEYLQWTTRAQQLLEGAEWFQHRDQPGLGVFLLHQSAELALMAVIRVATGYRASTHQLERLIRLAVCFCGSDFNIFPAGNREKKLRQLLQRAYIHGRYKDDFFITPADLTILLQRIKHLHQLSLQHYEAISPVPLLQSIYAHN
jgi:HEPN domain-containing protein